MVRGILIPHRILYKDLVGNSDDRDSLLCKTYGINNDELSGVRQGTTLERAYKAAVLLREHDFGNQIDLSILPAVMYKEWDNPVKYVGRISKALEEKYKNQAYDKKMQYEWSIPYIQLFREEVGGIYSGNLYEAKDTWDNFIPGQTDWSRSVKIPAKINEREAELIGMYWGDGFLTEHNGKLEKLRYTMHGNKNSFDLYTSVINPSIREIHGLEIAVKSKKRQKDTVNIDDYTFLVNPEHKNPIIFFGSHAITTWLKYDLRFPSPKLNVDFPRTYDSWSDEIAYAYLRGILATMGSVIRHSPTDKYMRIIEQDEPFAKNIQRLAARLNYNSKINTAVKTKSLTNILTFSSKELKRMIDENAIINPYHLSLL